MKVTIELVAPEGATHFILIDNRITWLKRVEKRHATVFLVWVFDSKIWGSYVYHQPGMIAITKQQTP